jgi:hypothetical protein
MQKLPVVFRLGPRRYRRGGRMTHTGAFELSFDALRALPGGDGPRRRE